MKRGEKEGVWMDPGTVRKLRTVIKNKEIIAKNERAYLPSAGDGVLEIHLESTIPNWGEKYFDLAEVFAVPEEGIETPSSVCSGIIDWGDGTVISSSSTGSKFWRHNYGRGGSAVITLRGQFKALGRLISNPSGNDHYVSGRVGWHLGGFKDRIVSLIVKDYCPIRSYVYASFTQSGGIYDRYSTWSMTSATTFDGYLSHIEGPWFNNLEVIPDYLYTGVDYDQQIRVSEFPVGMFEGLKVRRALFTYNMFFRAKLETSLPSFFFKGVQSPALLTHSMFGDATGVRLTRNFFNIDSSWSSEISTENMFTGSDVTSVPDLVLNTPSFIGSWMFADCAKLTHVSSQFLSNFSAIDHLNVSYMFIHCSKLIEAPQLWNNPALKNVPSLFYYGCFTGTQISAPADWR